MGLHDGLSFNDSLRIILFRIKTCYFRHCDAPDGVASCELHLRIATASNPAAATQNHGYQRRRSDLT